MDRLWLSKIWVTYGNMGESPRSHKWPADRVSWDLVTQSTDHYWSLCPTDRTISRVTQGTTRAISVPGVRTTLCEESSPKPARLKSVFAYEVVKMFNCNASYPYSIVSILLWLHPGDLNFSDLSMQLIHQSTPFSIHRKDTYTSVFIAHDSMHPSAHKMAIINYAIDC